MNTCAPISSPSAAPGMFRAGAMACSKGPFALSAGAQRRSRSVAWASPSTSALRAYAQDE